VALDPVVVELIADLEHGCRLCRIAAVESFPETTEGVQILETEPLSWRRDPGIEFVKAQRDHREIIVTIAIHREIEYLLAEAFEILGFNGHPADLLILDHRPEAVRA
jgi:hypothetical protein